MSLGTGLVSRFFNTLVCYIRITASILNVRQDVDFEELVRDLNRNSSTSVGSVVERERFEALLGDLVVDL